MPPVYAPLPGRRVRGISRGMSRPSWTFAQMSKASKSASSSAGGTTTVGDFAMAAQLSPETRSVLQQYLAGALTLDGLDDWLTQAEYDADLSRDERDALAVITLAVIEAGEGLGSTEDIRQAVEATLLADSALPLP